jgi:zinc transport system substrate-binding protein
VITRTILISLFGIALTLGATACGEDSGASAGDTRVVAGFYPLAFAAEQIGGDRVDVTNLTPAGAEPHDLELTPREVEDILDADLVLYVGDGFQPGVEEAAAESDGEAIDVLDGLDVRDDDPHVWLDPILFSQVIERIGAALDDEDAAQRLASRLRALDRQYREGLADCERRELVTTHDAFGYLAERYGLQALPITGLSPEGEPSPQDLQSAIDVVESNGVTTVFTEPLLSPEVGETVAREAGATTAELDPLEGLTDDELSAGEDYFSVMESNLEALRTGLGCR